MTNEIENTRFIMFNALHTLRKAKKHPKMLANFESVLEDHLEALRKEASEFQARIGELYSSRQQWEDIAALRLSNLSAMTEERDQIQQRLHAVDRAYFEQSQRNGEQARQIEKLEELNRIAGEELIRVQEIARENLEDVKRAEKHSDRFSEQLRDAQSFIANQEQLIVGQRLAISDMHTELTHSRVIRKALQRAQGAFESLDESLHGGKVYEAQKALGDDLVDAEFQP